MSRLLVGGLMAFVIGGVAFAQAPPVPAIPKEYQEMAAAVAAAQAKAVRPGDEALGCAAIEKELMQLQAVPAGRGAANPQAAAAMAAALANGATVPPARQGTAPTPQQALAMQQALAAQQALANPQVQAALQAQGQALANPQVQAALQAHAQALANPQVQAALQAQAQAFANPQIQAALAAQGAPLAQLLDPSAQLAVTTVMPQMMRSQRLIGLGMAKGCPTLGGAAPVVPAKK
jgi:hypothetical protein